ncbi:hypothetical protein EDB89DRAFT_2026264 [Lactarius sanguifluus]|nr:hypothetical protein EDB89DRAFT_2026264 [Lactarius sanguifluus]
MPPPLIPLTLPQYSSHIFDLALIRHIRVRVYNKPTLDSQIQWLCFPFSVSWWPGYSIQVMTRANVLTRQLGQRSIHVVGVGIFCLFRYPSKTEHSAPPHALWASRAISVISPRIYAIAIDHSLPSPYTQILSLSPRSLSLSPTLASLPHGPPSMQIPSQAARKPLVGRPHVPVPCAVLCPSLPGFVASSISPFSFIISPVLPSIVVESTWTPFILWLSLATVKMLSLAALSNAPIEGGPIVVRHCVSFPFVHDSRSSLPCST